MAEHSSYDYSDPRGRQRAFDDLASELRRIRRQFQKEEDENPKAPEKISRLRIHATFLGAGGIKAVKKYSTLKKLENFLLASSSYFKQQDKKTPDWSLDALGSSLQKCSIVLVDLRGDVETKKETLAFFDNDPETDEDEYEDL